MNQGTYYKNFQPSNADESLIKSQLNNYPYVTASYFLGSSPENNYTIPEGELSFELSSNNYSGDKDNGPFKVFIKCSGAASPRPMTLKKNDKGIWKAHEFSSLVVGIQKPSSANPPSDDL